LVTNYLLEEEKIIEMKDKFKERKVGLESIKIKYHISERSVSIEGNGIEGIPQNEEYYENLEDNLTFADFSWLTPICKDLKTNMNFTLDVLPDGNFDHSKIKAEITLSLPLRSVKRRTLAISNSFFKQLLKYRNFGTMVEFKGHENYLTAIKFFLVIDGRKLNTLIQNAEEKINNQFLSQWTTALDYVLDYNKGEFKYISKLPIINGRIVTSSFQSSVCFRYKTTIGSKKDLVQYE
jgi:hypothetical protein